MSDTQDRPGRRRKWPRRTVVIVVAVLAVLHLGGGWYFAGQLRADGLEPRLPSRDLGVRVLAVTEEMITLDGSDRDGIEQIGVAGLWWPEGYGRLGAVVDVNGTAVTRAFSLEHGSPPSPCATVDPECPEVDIESVTYRAHPGDAGLAYDDVIYESPLGPMRAWLVPPPDGPGDTWALHVHGWRTDRRETLRMLPAFGEADVTSLVIEYRNDAEAPTDPSGFYRFGRTEWEDVEGAVRFAMDNGAARIVLVGYSTGAAVQLAFLEQSQLTDGVVGAVFDSPNIDFGRVVRHEASQRTIPGTPIPLPPTLTATAMWLADLRYDVDWKAVDYASREGILDAPALVFHGAADDSVPLDVSERLREEYPDLVDLVVTPDAGHVQSWNVDPDCVRGDAGPFSPATRLKPSLLGCSEILGVDVVEELAEALDFFLLPGIAQLDPCLVEYLG